ncbi:MAG: glutamate-1-semialdehyde 2,1-aminomutase [Capsulimonadaceae bacterium]
MPYSYSRSAELFKEAQKVIPGGVNSPVRAFKGVGGDPLFISHGSGSRIVDVDGNSYIDYVMSWGPLIFGHAPEHVRLAVADALDKGTSFGASTEREVLLAEAIVAAVPSVEKVRLVNSGTEAVMSAVRVARGYTRRNKIIKFEGNYHGHSDGFLSQSGSGLLTLGLPDSAGVPPTLTHDTITLPYNDAGTFLEAMAANHHEIACVVVEPVAGNMGVVLPAPGFLETIRARTRTDGTLLLFDEVITGFRLSYGGAQERFGILPDLTSMGKIIGGGLPLAAYGGRSDIMDCVAPVGPVYQAGTLSGNPLAVAAGLAQITELERGRDHIYQAMESAVEYLAQSAAEAAARNRVPVRINRIASMMTIFFTGADVTDFTTAKTADTKRFAAFFRSLLDQGVYIAPSQFEAGFVSTSHTDDDLAATVAAMNAAFDALGR